MFVYIQILLFNFSFCETQPSRPIVLHILSSLFKVCILSIRYLPLPNVSCSGNMFLEVSLIFGECSVPLFPSLNLIADWLDLQGVVFGCSIFYHQIYKYIKARVCGSKFFMGGHEEMKQSISWEISKFLLHKSKKDGGAQAPSAPPVPHPLNPSKRKCGCSHECSFVNSRGEALILMLIAVFVLLAIGSPSFHVLFIFYSFQSILLYQFRTMVY